MLTLAGLYRAARAALVTPLRDGMNLVAKEYVASQSSTDPGVLILSRFAGAAQELDCALIVNPYDTDVTAAAIARALVMPIEERRERWSALMARIQDNTVEHWCTSFVDALAEDGLASLPAESLVTREAEAGRTGRMTAPSSRVRN